MSYVFKKNSNLTFGRQVPTPPQTERQGTIFLKDGPSVAQVLERPFLGHETSSKFPRFIYILKNQKKLAMTDVMILQKKKGGGVLTTKKNPV